MNSSAPKRQMAAVAILSTLAFLTTPAMAQDRNLNPGVQPINSKPHGLSYGEWSARWWQWILSIPAETNPNLDTTGEQCGQGQSGHVWYLAGSFGGGPYYRTCTVPTGTSFLFPILNAAFGAGLADCLTPVFAPGACEDYTFGALKGVPALEAAVAALLDNPTLLAVTVDGVPLQQLASYRAKSPAFSYTVTNQNVLSELLGVNLPAGTYTPAVSNGYWIMLNPLPPGTHTIHFEGVLAGGFSTGGITYTLIVTPGKKK